MTRIIDQPVLVLNKHWQPVAVLSVGVAVTTVLRGMGWVLDPQTYELLEFEAWCTEGREAHEAARRIPTPRGSLPAPDVIVLREYAEQPKRRVSFSRRNLERRDRQTCQYCGRRVQASTIDHVVPRSKGGPTTWENCVLACSSCNHRKANRTPREAGMPLRTDPRRPSWRPSFTVAKAHFRETWEPFLRKGAVSLELAE